MSNRLLERYGTEVVPALQKQFEYTNPMQVPRLEKIVVNIGLGEALTNAKAVDAAVGDLALITGQKPITTKAKRSIAQFHLRTGNTIGAKVTLRGERMWDFLERLTDRCPSAHPRLPGDPRQVVRRARQLQPRAPRAARVPRDRLRQGRPSPRAGDQHRDDGEDRRGVPQVAGAPRHALRRLSGEETMAKKSLIAKAKRTPKHKSQGVSPLHPVRTAAGVHAPLRALSYLLPGARPRGRAAGRDEVQLVSRR